MKKILIYLIVSTLVLFHGQVMAQSLFSYENSDSAITLTTKERYELTDKQKDPALSALFSGLCIGAGQMYGGDMQKGLWVMGIGLGLTIGTFGILLPDLDKRPASAANLGKVLAYLLWGGYYLWNIRDAYDVSLQNNEKIDKILIQN